MALAGWWRVLLACVRVACALEAKSGTERARDPRQLFAVDYLLACTHTRKAEQGRHNRRDCARVWPFLLSAIGWLKDYEQRL